MALNAIDSIEHFRCRQGADIARQRIRQEALNLGLLVYIVQEAHDLKFRIARQVIAGQRFFKDDVAAMINQLVIIHFDMNQGRFAEDDVAGRDDAQEFLRLAGFLQGVDGSIGFFRRNIQ